MSEPTWRRASRCDSNGCVEVAITGTDVAIRDSTRPDTPPLTFTAQDWRVFVAGVKAGEFDAPPQG